MNIMTSKIISKIHPLYTIYYIPFMCSYNIYYLLLTILLILFHACCVTIILLKKYFISLKKFKKKLTNLFQGLYVFTIIIFFIISLTINKIITTVSFHNTKVFFFFDNFNLSLNYLFIYLIFFPKFLFINERLFLIIIYFKYLLALQDC